MTQWMIFSWGNNPKRATLKGRLCKVVTSGAKNSCLVEFEDGQREIVSIRALRAQTPSSQMSLL